MGIIYKIEDWLDSHKKFVNISGKIAGWILGLFIVGIIISAIICFFSNDCRPSRNCNYEYDGIECIEDFNPDLY